MRLTAADVNQLADRVRNEYLTRKRDTEPVAEALDILHKILVWAEAPPEHLPDAYYANAFKAHVRLIAGQE